MLFFFLTLISLFKALCFSLGSGAPVCVVDCGVLEERRKDEDETHDEINIYETNKYKIYCSS